MRRQVELYFNESDGSRFWSYVPEARMRCGERSEMELPERDGGALDEIWALFNADDRPNGRYERSLSVADVITLDGKKSYAVTSTGFREVELLSADEVVRAVDFDQPGHEVKKRGEFGA